jgi:plastocyanin
VRNPIKQLLSGALATGVLLATTTTTSVFAQEMAADPNAVVMQGNLFVQAEMTVPVGTTLTWTNLDAEDHDVIATNDPSFAAPLFMSPLIKTGETWSFTFDAPGSYGYLCDLHADMVGVVNVVEGAPAAAAEGSEAVAQAAPVE